MARGYSSPYHPGLPKKPDCGAVPVTAEVNISPKISISAQPLKLALHKNPAMHGSRIILFLQYITNPPLLVDKGSKTQIPAKSLCQEMGDASKQPFMGLKPQLTLSTRKVNDA